jgi:hypothetical protein
MNSFTSNSPKDKCPDYLNDELFPLTQMIPGIVHNISNPLTIIKVRSQILQNKMPESPVFPALIDNVAKIEDILGNLSDRVDNLHNPDIRPICLKNLVVTEIKYLEADPIFKHKITKHIEIQESQPFIKAVYGHLSCGFLAAIMALIRMMENCAVRKLGIRVFCHDEQIHIHLSATAPGLAEEDIRFFKQLRQFATPTEVLAHKPQTTAEFLLLMRSFFCFKPYISDFSLSRKSEGEFECLINFPIAQ